MRRGLVRSAGALAAAVLLALSGALALPAQAQTTPTLSIANAEEPEGDDLTFTWTLSPAAAAEVTATWTASFETGDTAGLDDLDYSALSDATGTLTIAANVTTGTVESSLTSVNPYVRYEASERLSVWGLLGYGTGDMTMTQAARGERAEIVTRTDISMRLGAAGARGVLLKAGEDGGIDLALRGDAFLVQMDWEKVSNETDTGADASRLRLVLEGGRSFALGEGAVLMPALELGLRHDGGDAETGTGVELGGRISYTDAGSGLTVEANARKLIAHEDSGYEEWGAGGSVRLDPGASGRGLSLSLAPVWGTPSSGVERLWSARDAAGLVRDDDFEAERRLEGEIGYGFGAFGERGVVTPYAGFGLAEAGDRTWRAGARWSLAPHLAMSLDGARREPANDDAPEHGVQFRLTLRW